MPKTQDQTKQDGNLSIPRVGKRKEGYDPAQVDEFLERSHQLYDSPEPRLTQEEIQNTSFSIVKNGYSVAEVDAALTRLEGAVVDKRTQWDVQHYGRVAWRARTDTLARSLHDRAARPHGERFSDGLPNKPSYDRKQVDHMIDCVIAQIAGKLGKTSGIAVEGAPEPKKWRKDPDEWTLPDVADIMFTRHTGHHGYDERQVDAYINRMLQVLARIESFERIEGPISSTDSARSFEDGYADGLADGMARQAADAQASGAAGSAANGTQSFAQAQQAFSALVAATEQAASATSGTADGAAANGPVSQEFSTSSIAPIADAQPAFDPAAQPASFAPSHSRNAAQGGNAAADVPAGVAASAPAVPSMPSMDSYTPVDSQDAPTVASPDLARRIDELTQAKQGGNTAQSFATQPADSGMPQSFAPKGYVPRTPLAAQSRDVQPQGAQPDAAPAAQTPISFADAKHVSERGNMSFASLVSDTMSSRTIQPGAAPSNAAPSNAASAQPQPGLSVPTGVAASAPAVAPLIPQGGQPAAAQAAQSAQAAQPTALNDDTPASGIIPAVQAQGAQIAQAQPNTSTPASTASARFDADGFPLAETGDLTGPIPPLGGNPSQN